MSVIETATNSVIKQFEANGPSNDVSVVDTEALRVVATITTGERPWGVAVVPLSRR